MRHVLTLISILVPILAFALTIGFVIPYARRRSQSPGLLGPPAPPGPLTCGEVMSRLHADHLSLADRREVASQLQGQRVRWTGTFCNMFQTRGSWTVLCTGDVPRGVYKNQFFFDPTGADRGRLERAAQGARLVVEGTVRIDLNNDLVTLEGPVVRFDLPPSPSAA
jgi:hypothetical protein